MGAPHGSRDQFTEATLRCHACWYRVDEVFRVVLAREDHSKTKANPEPYQLALERLGLSATGCIAVEDSERGLAAARAAGLRCIVIPNEMTCRCTFSGATAILPGAAAVLDALPEL